MSTSQRVDRAANTAQEMIEAQRGFYEAWTNSIVDSQKRAVRFDQSAVDSAVPQQHSAASRPHEVVTEPAKIWQSWLKTGADYAREQSSESQRLSEAFARSARAQQGSFQKLGEEWIGLYGELLSSAYSYGQQGVKNTAEASHQGIQAVQNTVGQGSSQNGSRGEGSSNGSSVRTSSENGFPIEDYDDLGVNKIADRLGGLSEEDLRKLLEHEKANKDRSSLVQQLERKISA